MEPTGRGMPTGDAPVPLELVEEAARRLARVPDPLPLLQALFAFAPVGFQVYTAEGRCLLTNQAFRDLFGSEPPPDYSDATSMTGRARVRPALTRGGRS